MAPRSPVRLAGLLAVLLASAVATPASAVLRPIEGRATFRIGSLEPIAVTATGVADLGGSQLESVLSIPASLFVGSFSVPVTDPQAAPIRGVAGQFQNDPGVFRRASADAAFAGEMPMRGFAKVCLFFGCDAAPLANVTLPLSLLGRRGLGSARTAAINLTVVGAPWTTGTIGGVSSTTPTKGAIASGDQTLVASLVTPIFIRTNIPAIEGINANGRIELVVGAGCDDGVDNDGDGRIDAVDPGCSGPEDPSERGAATACDDGVDQDGDRRIDFPNDLGCSGPDDGDEANVPACFSGTDDEDGDGRTSFAFGGAGRDIGCTDWYDPTETSPLWPCDDGEDDDGDGLVDLDDPGCASSPDPSEADVVECANGIDDDGDGVTDFPLDLGCADASDATETSPCENGRDDDGDGLADFPLDPGCFAEWDPGERQAIECDDGIDNDHDGRTDMQDPGCTDPLDGQELDYPQCADGVDNDWDGRIDHGDDPGCTNAADLYEKDPALACDDGVDNEGDGKHDFLHPDYDFDPFPPPAGFGDAGCSGPDDPSEYTGAVCDDGIDNDGDGATDYPADPGCGSLADPAETGTAKCDDGLDNDGDGATDYPADPGCASGADPSEADVVECGNGIDDDGDGAIDHPNDPGCDGPGDPLETSYVGCDNGRDDDRDGLADQADPGCGDLHDEFETSSDLPCDDSVDADGDGRVGYNLIVPDHGCSGPSDSTETADEFACDDGLDNDGDGLIDFQESHCRYTPVGPGQLYTSDTELRPDVDCDDGVDDDGDGLVDWLDPGCVGSLDLSERSPIAACDDGVDQDGDEDVDYPADADCASVADPVEGPAVAACQNGQDDDGDGWIDGADAACEGPDDPEEFVLLDDGSRHVVDAETTWGGSESARVADGATPTSLAIEANGVIGHRVVVGGTSSVDLDGGHIGGDLIASDDASVTITDGTLVGTLRTSGEATAYVSGGILPAIEASGSSSVAVRMVGLPRGPVTAAAGVLTGTFIDGTEFEIPYLRASGAVIELVPEPESAASALAAIALLLARRAVRRR